MVSLESTGRDSQPEPDPEDLGGIAGKFGEAAGRAAVDAAEKTIRRWWPWFPWRRKRSVQETPVRDGQWDAAALLHFVAHSSRDLSGEAISPIETFDVRRNKFDQFCRHVTQYVNDFFRKYYVHDCSCCIKWCLNYSEAERFAKNRVEGTLLPPQDDEKDPTKSIYLYTAARDAESLGAREDWSNICRADYCTPFLWLLRDAPGKYESRFWVSNGDLQAAWRRNPPKTPVEALEFHRNGFYYTERDNFFRHYKSGLVLSMRYVDRQHQKDRKGCINAFLCLDSPTVGAFEKLFGKINRQETDTRKLPPWFNVVAAVSDSLWLPHEQYIENIRSEGPNMKDIQHG